MADLVARFGKLADEYESRKSAATALVERWDWYTWPGLDLRPLFFERDLLKPGRRMETRPPMDQNVMRIGFDAAGRMTVTEGYSGFLSGRLHYETFVRYDGEAVESAHFDPMGPVYLHEYRFDGTLMRSAHTVARGGSGRETYAYSSGRISRVEIEHDRRPRSVLTAEHDDRGLVSLVEVVGQFSTMRYERPPAGFDLDAECQAVADSLVERIPAVAARLAVDGPVDCVALSYYRAAPLSFEIAAATADERAELRSVDPELAWSPAEFDANADIDLDEVGSLRLVRQELALLDAEDVDAAAGAQVGRRLLCAVAARLNLLDWSRTLTVTDDFVVYAVDLELVDLEANLADCLAPDRLARLRERGWWPNS
ncbi:hypothetical protein [Cryptosporangium aurantiacum]|uniref:Uncharacterized protein n=1 Tax=Cryptosporangium aurantiacum TaxID=134849 RepID=A0A1M7R1S8_9ACTN|nr:hypothetical protein [Cryptosporangium aurantiacum]SHN38699.1 hypothetical protein SAMN05443668_106121 [Cryptosporangium aurantiacum]